MLSLKNFIAGTTITFFIITIVIVVNKNKLLENKWTWYVIFISIFFILLLNVIFYINGKTNFEEKELNNNYDLAHYFKQINDEIKKMYGTSDIDWGGGYNIRYKIKHYGKQGKFLGLIGLRSESNSIVVVVAKLLETNGKIEIYDYNGDTNDRDVINNPLHGFNPSYQDQYNLYNNFLKYDDKRSRRKYQPNVIINPNGNNNEHQPQTFEEGKDMV